MRRLLAHRPSPAMVVACVALAVALGGTGYAAIKLPRNSVGNAQLKSDAVSSAKVRNGSLTERDFGGSLPRGPRGPTGPKGDAGAPATSQLSQSGFASREGPIVPLTPPNTMVDVLDLAVPTGSSGYLASSGNITVSAPSRLVAVANVTVHSDAAASSLFCRLLLDAKPFGVTSNGALVPSSHLSLSVTGGVDVEPGASNVRVQCSVTEAGFAFHRGNLTVVATPR